MSLIQNYSAPHHRCRGLRISLLLAILLCLALRLLFLAIPATPLQTKIIDSIPDASEYATLARNLANQHVFSRSAVPPYRPEVLRTPGYPLFIAPFYLVSRNPLLPAIIAQLLLSSVLVWATFRFCTELALAEGTCHLAALLVAVSPNLAFISTKLVTETLFTLLLILTLSIYHRLHTFNLIRDAVACGVACGLLMLIRPIAILFPVLLSFLSLIRKHTNLIAAYPASYLRRSLNAALVVFCAALTVLPWLARNQKLTGRWLLSTAGEHNLFLFNAAAALAVKNNITLTEARELMRREATARFGLLDTTNEAQFWQRLSQIAWRHILQTPGPAIEMQLLGFFFTLFSPISIRPLAVHSGTNLTAEPHLMQQILANLARGRLKEAATSAWHNRLSQLGIFGLSVLIAASIFQLGLLVLTFKSLLSRQGRTLVWFIGPILYFSLLTGPLGEARMRVPFEPLLAISAAASLVSSKAKWRDPHPPSFVACTH